MTRDPIEVLAEALYDGRPPPLAWLLRWRRDGHDPVAAAWQVSQNGYQMGRVLAFAGVDAGYGELEIRWSPTPEAAAHLRRRVPRPPPLRALLTRLERPAAGPDAATVSTREVFR
jgi:hypothetical protein